MVKTIKQLKVDIAVQKARIGKETLLSKNIEERNKFSRQLFQLKNRRFIGAGAKVKRLSKQFGKAILKVGRKTAPIIKKQAQLIRDQQLRDNELTRARVKTATTKTFVKGKGKKPLFKRVKVKVKIPKRAKKAEKGLSIFEPLDF